MSVHDLEMIRVLATAGLVCSMLLMALFGAAVWAVAVGRLVVAVGITRPRAER